MECATRPEAPTSDIDISSLKLCTKTIPESTSLLVQPNCEPFNCATCLQRFDVGEGIILTNCLHEFCRQCIVATIHETIDFVQVKCPFNIDYECESFLSEREIRGLVTVDEYNQFIQNSQNAALSLPDKEMIKLKEPPRKTFKRNPEDEVLKSQQSELDCPRCSRTFLIQNGIVLKNCKHSICKECIIDHFFKNQKYQMICEFRINDQTVCGCGIYESEIRLVLSEVGLAEPIVRRKYIFVKKNTFIAEMLQDENLMRNEVSFWCGICFLDCPIGKGVKLKKCSHHVCEPCLRYTIKMNSDPKIRCPYSKSYENCSSFLMDCEIENLTSWEEFQQFKQIAIRVSINVILIFQR